MNAPLPEKLTAQLADIAPETTAHGAGTKQVFLRSTDTPTALTQAAYGTFAQADYCAWHAHPTMEEIFFIQQGEGIYYVGDAVVPLRAGVFVRIPAGVRHRLETTSAIPLEYVYVGVATT